MTAVTVDEPTVGSVWVPVRPAAGRPAPGGLERWSKALTVWWNSTLGVATIIAAAKTNVLSRPELPIATMNALPVSKLTEDQTEALARVFDEHAVTPLSALDDPGCPVRSALDEAVANVLGWDPEAAARARAELAREPSVQPSRRRPRRKPPPDGRRFGSFAVSARFASEPKTRSRHRESATRRLEISRPQSRLRRSRSLRWGAGDDQAGDQDGRHSRSVRVAGREHQRMAERSALSRTRETLREARPARAPRGLLAFAGVCVSMA